MGGSSVLQRSKHVVTYPQNARERVASAAMFDGEVEGRFMSDTSNKQMGTQRPTTEAVFAPGRRAEFFVFAIIAAFIWPAVAVGVVGGYGFIVWMSQVILGPPGPPGG